MQSAFDFHPATGAYRDIPIDDGALRYFAHAFGAAEADGYFAQLLAATPWRQDEIQVHGRTIPLPRLQAWYADGDKPLRYSGMTIAALAWTRELQTLRDRVTTLTGVRFDGVLVNCYRDGNDSVGWHSDDEPEFGPDPVIASVSFGATREFQLKHRFDRTLPTVRLDLEHGSVLLMGVGTQRFWRHQLPKRRRIDAARLNLTFRQLPS